MKLLFHSLTSSLMPRNTAIIFSKIPINNNQRPHKFPGEQPMKTQRNQSNFIPWKKKKKVLLQITATHYYWVCNFDCYKPESKDHIWKSTSCCWHTVFCCYCCSAAIFLERPD